eukprot:CAMPEP_0114581800 /NCGR_PEP_ID=MMETSP0125-20121206/5873_1 /TAXON_ID=485358 ORGANISM="Aristerostoma sp., Strain ATCC 50986" /NCGR_SAMPLE_ID=MMETSP0125 /ASSEMBLY_ACC=CAM_ASM_000245 /LENGTH=181 /DNA_ID=CAMNT_0001774299 /DNA_START=520 /DNA_END=1066 /DNA_ORIENTATION=-
MMGQQQQHNMGGGFNRGGGGPGNNNFGGPGPIQGNFGGGPQHMYHNNSSSGGYGNDSKAISIIILVEVVVVVCITTEISPIEAEDIKAKAALIRAVANMVVTSKVEIIDTKEVPSNITNKANSKANSNNTEAQETIKAEEIRATSITRKEVAADPTIKIKDLDKVANHIEVVEVDQDQNET